MTINLSVPTSLIEVRPGADAVVNLRVQSPRVEVRPEGLPKVLLGAPGIGSVVLGVMAGQAIMGPPGASSTTPSFEIVSQNLSAVDATYTYDGDELATVVLSNGITKTLGYGPDGLQTVTLSGATPGGIDLTKTLTYSPNGDLVAKTYS